MSDVEADSKFVPFLSYAIKPNETVKGGTYGDWIAAWHKWLLGDYVAQELQSEILFLVGNLSYGYAQDQKRAQQKKSNNRLRNKGVIISNRTSLFIPVMTTFHTIAEHYEDTDLLNEGALRQACEDDIQHGGKIYLTVETKSHGVTKLVDDLVSYNFVTSLFDLEVSDRNPLKDRLDVPIAVGRYRALASGFYVIVGHLPSEEKHYRLKFGGKGKGDYETDAEYDITVVEVTPKNRENRSISGLDLDNPTPIDISNKKVFSSSPFL
jgi:hypothetical protein